MRSPVLVAVGVSAAVAVVAAWDPNESGHYPTCPFLATTGFTCPGCGSLRATHALLQGDLATAWHRNPGLLVALPLLFLTWVASMRRAWTGAPRSWIVPNWLLAPLPVLIAAYWVLRNVPGFEFLGPN